MTADAIAALATVLTYFVSVLKVTPGLTWTCARCGHEELGAPVFLTTAADGRGASLPYGSGCAAVLLYGDRRHAARVRAAADGAGLFAAAVAEDIALVAGIAREWIAAAEASGLHLVDAASHDRRFDALRVRIAKGIAAGRIAPGLPAEVARLADGR